MQLEKRVRPWDFVAVFDMVPDELVLEVSGRIRTPSDYVLTPTYMGIFVLNVDSGLALPIGHMASVFNMQVYPPHPHHQRSSEIPLEAKPGSSLA